MSGRPYRSMEGPDVGSQKNSGYIWLAYSAFFIIDPILSHSRRLWIESGIIYAIFLAIYVGYMKAHTTRQRYMLLAAFYVLGLIGFPINTGASSFFVYSAAFLPFIIASTRTLIAVLAAQVLGLLAEGFLLHINLVGLLLTACLMTVVAASNAVIARQKRADFKLRMAHE